MQDDVNKLLIVFLLTLVPFYLNAQPQKAFNSFGILLETGAPNLGFSYYGSNADGWGGYATLSYSIFTGVKDDFVYDNLTVNSFDDPKVSEAKTSAILNGGIVRHVYNKKIYFYAGIGYTGFQEYAELDDPTGILGDDNGHYWVKTSSSEGVNINFGTIFTLKGGVSLNVGYISKPRALSVGIGGVF